MTAPSRIEDLAHRPQRLAAAPRQAPSKPPSQRLPQDRAALAVEALRRRQSLSGLRRQSFAATCGDLRRVASVDMLMPRAFYRRRSPRASSTTTLLQAALDARAAEYERSRRRRRTRSASPRRAAKAIDVRRPHRRRSRKCSTRLRTATGRPRSSAS